MLYNKMKALFHSMRSNGIKKTSIYHIKRFLQIADYSESIDTLYYFLNQYVDIHCIPPAEGVLREKQLNDVVLLRIFDKICKDNNINYFLAFGTLLGAIRHKGFIPWDDDLDVYILRNDYEAMKIIIRDSIQQLGGVVWINPSLAAESICLGFENSGVWLDIFPLDCFHSNLDLGSFS